MAETNLQRVCNVSDLETNWGEVALIGDHQYAVFLVKDGSVFVTDHKDPASEALVMARGIVGEKDGKHTVTAPLYKEVYDLETGECLSGKDFTLPVYDTAVEDGVVYIKATA